MQKKMKVLFFTHDSLYSSRVLAEIVRIPTIEVMGVVQSTAIMRRGKPILNDGLKLLAFSGARYAVYLMKTTLFYKKLARRFAIPTLKETIKKYDIPLIKSNNVNTVAVENFVAQKGPDLCITAFFNQMIMSNLLQIPSQGFINLHPSLLPKNRGVDPVFYAYLRKEHQGGVTVHRLDQSIDTGHILLQTPIDLQFDQSLLINQWNHFDAGASLVGQVLRDIDTFMPGSQQDKAGNYDSWPHKKLVKKIGKLT